MKQNQSFAALAAPFQTVPFRLSLWQKTDKANAAGKAPISLRITLNGQRAEVSTRIRVAVAVRDEAGDVLVPSEWDNQLHCVRGHSQLASQLNEELQLLLSRVRHLATLMTTHGRPVTAKSLAKQLKKPFVAVSPCFIVLCREQLERHYRGGNACTCRRLTWAVDRLAEWRGALGPLPVSEFTPRLATDFYQWLLRVRGNKASTATAAVESLTALFKRAVDEEVVEMVENPFRRLRRQKSAPVERLRLTSEQFCALRDAALPKKIALARDVYVAQYYLHGSRVGAVLLLRWSNVVNGTMQFRAEKSGPQKCIAIAPPLQEILARYARHRGTEDGFIFPFLPADFFTLGETERLKARMRAVALINLWLQKAALLVGIAGKLHSHTARHTLALHAADIAGVRVAQTMLGHKNSRQTEAYIGQLRESALVAAQDSIYGALAPTAPGFEPAAGEESGRIIPFRFSA